MPLGQASEKITFRGLQDGFGNGAVLAYRAFTVVTLDGKKHKGRRIRFEFDHVRIFHLNNSWEDLPGDQISRIEIRQAGRYSHHILESAEAPLLFAALGCAGLSSDSASAFLGCMIPLTAIFSPAWAYTAASAPFILAADAVTLFIPPKVYEIVH